MLDPVWHSGLIYVHLGSKRPGKHMNTPILPLKKHELTHCHLLFTPFQEAELERPSKLWQVLGGRSKGGIVVRQGCEIFGRTNETKQQAL